MSEFKEYIIMLLLFLLIVEVGGGMGWSVQKLSDYYDTRQRLTQIEIRLDEIERQLAEPHLPGGQDVNE